MLSQRSQEKELLDLGSDYYTAEEFAHCQKMLFRANKIFGFFKDTVRVLKKFPNNATVLDVGCGAGLFLLHLSHIFPFMTLVGTDISLSAITLAQQALAESQNNNSSVNVSFALQDSPELHLSANSVDAIMATLVCHHLNDEVLVEFLRQLLIGSKRAVIINDLHRHGIAEFFYALLSPVLFKNRLITHDGLISIRRGFTRREWETLLAKAKIENYTLQWCFPFRWILVLWKD